jgi:hypothetical protein
MGARNRAVADSYTAQRFSWFDALFSEKRLSNFEFRLAAAVWSFVSRKEFDRTGELMAWPSQPTLSAKLRGESPDVIRRAAKAIEQYGLWRRIISHGRGRATTYILASPGEWNTPAQEREYGDNTRSAERVWDTESPTLGRTIPDPAVAKTRSCDGANPLKGTLRNKNPLRAGARAPHDARGTRLPQDWEPSPDLRAHARRQGFNDAAIDRMAEYFRDYWIAEPDPRGRKMDWSATWRRWVAREQRRPEANRGDQIEWFER